MFAGDIVAAVGLKNTTTGDTLTDPGKPIVLERMEFPEPVISVAIEPKTKVDQDKLGKALGALSEEDPTFQVRTDDETGQTIISGMGELHLDVLVDRMVREFSRRRQRRQAPGRVPRDDHRAGQEVEERYVRQTGGRGQYGHVIIDLEPTGPGGGYEFVDKVRGGDDPARVHPRGRRRHPGGDGGRRRGWLPARRHAGHPHRRLVPRRRLERDGVQDRRLDGLQEGGPAAKPVLLEPIMAVEVVTPEDYMGDVIGDLSSRRGQVEGMEQRGTSHVVRAQVPLAEMFGYATDLRSRTQGRATYTMQFDSYQQVPESIAEEIVKRVRGE